MGQHKPKIAVIGLKGLPAYGGAATVGENIIEQLHDEFDFTVYSISSHTEFKTGINNDYKHIVFRSLPIKTFNTLYYYIASVFHVLFYSRYDLIHFHHRAAIFLLPIIRIKYKVVLTTHGMNAEPRFEKWSFLLSIQDKLFFRFANFITTVSKKDYKIVNKLVKSNRVKYIPNGINQSFSITASKTEQEYLVFAAGRIVTSKGCHTMLESLIKINYKGKILIIGDLTQNKKYKDKLFLLSNKLADVEFLGLIKNKQELLMIICDAKLFIYPSYLESMSMMMLEVASVQTPIICSDIPENRDIFDASEVLYAKPEDVNDWSNKISWALENPEEMKHKSINSYNKLVNGYLWKQIASQYSEIFKSLTTSNFDY